MRPSLDRFVIAALIVAVASMVSTTFACMVCKVPYRSLLDRIEQSERTIVVQRSDDPTRYQVIESIVGQVEVGSLVMVDQDQAVPQASRDAETRLLVWNSIGRYWMDEGLVTPDYRRFVRGALDRVSERPPIDSATVRDLETATEYFNYFVPFLEHRDEELADSAYTRIAAAPYRVLCNLGPQFEIAQLMRWLEKRSAPTENDRLYFVLLGMIGGDRESDLLSGQVESKYRSKNADDLASMLTALMQIDGESIVQLIEQRYLTDRDRTLDEIIAAISALRVHGRANHTISRTRVLASYQMLVRQRPALVELVIEDCLLWQDWTLAPAAMEIYAQRNQPWNDELLLRYLRACPTIEARQFLDKVAVNSL